MHSVKKDVIRLKKYDQRIIISTTIRRRTRMTFVVAII